MVSLSLAISAPLSWPGLSRPSTPSGASGKKDVDARDKPGHDELSALALPDKDQAQGSERRAIAGPLDLPDHEARCRPGDHTGALTDPQKPQGKREKA